MPAACLHFSRDLMLVGHAALPLTVAISKRSRLSAAASIFVIVSSPHAGSASAEAAMKIK